MAADVVMPRLSDSMEEGTVLQWLKAVGDAVSVGDELVEIETDKANMVYEADVAGTLIEILAPEGETMPVGAPIARVGKEGESPAPAERSPRSEPRAEPAPTHGPAKADGDRTLQASPLARRVAAGGGVDLATLKGSGPGGRILKRDVQRALADGAPRSAAGPRDAAPKSEAPGPEGARGATETLDLSKLQRSVARRMSESKATAPHIYLEAEVDMTRCVAARAGLKAAAGEGEVVPSFNDMVVKACAIALRQHPRANSAYRDGRIELYSRVNVGVAVAARDALVVPTIFDADRKGVAEIAAESRALAGRVRDGAITPPELSGGTFTVSNLGMYGIARFHPVINPPQAAILAVGSITERPVVRDGEVAAAHLMSVCLACDHRVLYGADGAELLDRIRALLEEPLALAS